MLIPTYFGYPLLEEYADFISTLQWYRMYCAARFGKDKNDYIEGFETLKAYSASILSNWPSEKAIPDWITRPVTDLLEEIDSILKSKRLTDERIGQIANLLWNFLAKGELKFRVNYVEYCVIRDAKRVYPKDLVRTVDALLSADHHDAAVLAAFRHLENYLQQTLDVPPHQYYGEALINYAFSPTSGVIQLETHPNEQAGLHNFFSGAYALFRNPSAHRYVPYDDFDAMAIISMVAMMEKMIANLQKRNEESEETA